jgi:hypothetical protein
MRNVFLLLSLATLALPSRKLDGQSCLGPDTASVRIIATIRGLVTGGPKAAQSRAMLHLPKLTASEVTLVTDEASCVRARQAQDSLVHATNPAARRVLPARAMYVVKFGTFNALVDPTNRMEGDSVLDLFDPNWAYLGSFSVYLGHP